jgi:hypothetical protein
MQLSDQRLQAADCGREVIVQGIDKMPPPMLLAPALAYAFLTSIIEIFFKRCANGCDAPLSSNRDVHCGKPQSSSSKRCRLRRELELTDGYSAIGMAQNSSGDAFGFRDRRRV